MVRSESIYPTTGFAVAPPHVPDPIGVLPATAYVPYISSSDGEEHTRQVDLGQMFDDNVYNSGGVCGTLDNWIEQEWQLCLQNYIDFPVIFAKPIYDSAIQAGVTQLLAPQTYKAVLTIFNPPEKETEWYGDSSFIKYGWMSFVESHGTVNALGSQWWNYPSQSFIAPSSCDGVYIWLNGVNSLGRLTLYKRAYPQFINYSDHLGNKYHWDEEGRHDGFGQ